MEIELTFLVYGVVYADNAYDCKRRLILYLQNFLNPTETIALVSNAHGEYEQGEDYEDDIKILDYPFSFRVVPDMRKASDDEIKHELQTFDELARQYMLFAIARRDNLAEGCRSLGIEMPSLLSRVGNPSTTLNIRKFQGFFDRETRLSSLAEIQTRGWKLRCLREAMESLTTDVVEMNIAVYATGGMVSNVESEENKIEIDDSLRVSTEMVIKRNIERAIDLVKSENTGNSALIGRDALIAGNSCWRDRIQQRNAPMKSTLSTFRVVEEDVSFDVASVERLLLWKKLRSGIEAMYSFHIRSILDDTMITLTARERLSPIVDAIDELEANFPTNVPATLRAVRRDFKTIMETKGRFGRLDPP
jgi:hypothetical protein